LADDSRGMCSELRRDTVSGVHVSHLPQILDLAALAVREGLRELRSSDESDGFGSPAIIAAFGMDATHLAALTRALVAAELIAPHATRPDAWELTELGRRASNANGARPITRQKALALAAGAVRRALAHNAGEAPNLIESLGLFGSAARDVITCSDVDVAYSLRRRSEDPAAYDLQCKASIARAQAAGRRFPSWADELFWSEREARLAITQGSAYINLHERDEVARLSDAAVTWLVDRGRLTEAGDALIAAHADLPTAAATIRRRAQRARVAAITLDDWWEAEWILDEELERGERPEACTARLNRERSHHGVEVTLLAGRGRRGRTVRFRQRWRDVFRNPVVSSDRETYALDLLSAAGLPFTKELARTARRAFDELQMAYYEERIAADAEGVE
jgi:hypothetical protein